MNLSRRDEAPSPSSGQVQMLYFTQLRAASGSVTSDFLSRWACAAASRRVLRRERLGQVCLASAFGRTTIFGLRVTKAFQERRVNIRMDRWGRVRTEERKHKYVISLPNFSADWCEYRSFDMGIDRKKTLTFSVQSNLTFESPYTHH